MIPSSFSGSVGSSSSSRLKCNSVSSQTPRTFMPFGRYADVGTQKIKPSRPDVRLHVGSASTLYLSKGTLLGKDITYISQVWNAWDAESTQMFYEQVLPYIDPETLRPLMGICAPTVVGIHSSAAGRFTLAMELPHPTGWHSADPYISAELKEKVIFAYQSIHGRNILHNDVKLENILIGDDDKVTVVDFCKMIVNPEPADLALEMRAVKFMLDYDGAKEVEYERLRRAKARTGKNSRRSWLRRAAESLGFGSGASHDEQTSRDDIDFLPFTRKCLVKWDSEVVTEGTTHCPGWRGERFKVPEDMRSPPWPRVEDQTPLSPPLHQPTDSATLAEAAFGPDSFSLHDRWMKRCHYFPCLWSPVVESVESGLTFAGTCSSSTSPIDFSDYATGSERNSTTGSELSEGGRPVTPPFARKRLRTEDLTRPYDHSHGNKRTRRSKSLESFANYQGGQTSWATRRTGGLDLPSPKQKGRKKELPPLVASSWESTPSEPDLSTLSDPSLSPGKSSTGSTSSTIESSPSRASVMTDPGPTQRKRKLATALPRRSCPRPKSGRGCSIVVMDSDEEDKVWFMSREALRDVKGYLQVKKATGAAVEMPSGWMEGGVQHSRQRVDRTMRSSSTRLTRKRVGAPEDNDEVAHRPKRRRSWPEIGPYGSKDYKGSLLYDG